MKKSFIVILCFFIVLNLNAVDNNFLENNLKHFSVQKLDNSIPVYFKEMDNVKTTQVYVMFSGGSSAIKYDESGIEFSVLQMLKRGSKKYTNADIQDVSYQTRMGLFSYCAKDYSIYGLFTLNHYFDKCFDVYLDTLLNPTFTESVFNVFYKELEQKVQASSQNSSSILLDEIYNTVYKNTPYQTDSLPRIDNLAKITSSSVKEHYTKMLDSSRISVIVVGSFSSKKILNKLNKSLGKIESKTFVPANIEEPKVIKGVSSVVSEQVNGSGLIAKIIIAPSSDSPDYIPFQIASSIYDEILFSVVREKYGCCYSINNNYLSNKKPVSFIFFYRVSDFDKILNSLSEAESIMKSGKIISHKNEASDFETVLLKDVFISYQNKLINSIYSSLITPSGVAAQIVFELANDKLPQEYLYYENKILECTAEQVVDVFNKYWVGSDSSWIVVSDSESLKSRASDFIKKVK